MQSDEELKKLLREVARNFDVDTNEEPLIALADLELRRVYLREGRRPSEYRWRELYRRLRRQAQVGEARESPELLRIVLPRVFKLEQTVEAERRKLAFILDTTRTYADVPERGRIWSIALLGVLSGFFGALAISFLVFDQVVYSIGFAGVFATALTGLFGFMVWFARDKTTRNPASSAAEMVAGSSLD